MKIFKCQNCKTVYNKPDKIIMVQCSCGYEAIHVDKNHNLIKENTKDAFCEDKQ